MPPSYNRMSSLLSLRNVVSNQTQINTAGLTVNNTALALGTSAGATKTNFSNGSYAASSWQTAQSGLNANKKIQMSATGQYQLDLTSPTPYLSTDSGATWTALGASNGLPTGSTAWLNGALSASGQYITLADSIGGFLYVSNDYGATFNNTTPTASAASLYSWLKFNGNATDSQGGATITVTGSPSYVTGVVPGSQAISLANTAGGTATQYVRGTWSGATNYTVSFWFNVQSLGSSQQILFSAYSGSNIIFINGSTNTMGIYIPSGGGSNTTNYMVSSPITVNTWYFVTAIFQTNGLCSFYLNNTLIASTVNSQGVGTYTSSNYSLGTYDTATSNPFNGYIDDFKLTNNAITYQPVPVIPPAVWLKMEGNTTDSGSQAITPTLAPSWTPAYVTGAVGLSAVRFANTAGSTATQYIRATSFPSLTNFTVSGWFNVQSFPSSLESEIIGLGNGTGPVFQLVCLPAGTIYLSYLTSVWNGVTSPVIALNTWYHFQINMASSGSGACKFYLNGSLVGSADGGTLNSAITILSLGAYPHSAAGAFNGYLDDIKIHATAVPFTPMIPANYNALAVSGSGQYQLASTQLGTVIQSADYGVTWTTNAAAAGPQQTQTELALSHAGQYAVAARRKVITPALVGNTSSSWYQNGVTWTASSSSNFSGGFLSQYAFDDNYGNGWASSSNYTNSGQTNSVKSTTVLGSVGTITGEWLQLQSSVPLVLSGFNYVGAGLVSQNMQNYFLCGSIDSTSWYPLQQGTMTTNPITTTNGRVQTVISVNYTGVQSLKGDQVGSVTTTAYPFATGSYTYFRLISRTTWGASEVVLGELYPQFVTNTISPQLTGLSSATWAQAGVNYTASASTTVGVGNEAFRAFSNTYASFDSWASTAKYNSSGDYITSGTVFSTTIQGGIGSISGEWLQIQLSTPLVLQSHLYACASYVQVPRSYYIVGSADGSIWYPIQYGVMTTNPFGTTNNSVLSSAILINYNGTQGIQASVSTTISTTSYSTSTSAYTYYRIIAPTIWPFAGTNAFQIGEWYLNFVTPSLVSNNTLSTWSANLPQIATSTNVPDSTALSASGQYLLQTTKIQPYAWLPFDNSATDLMANSALTVTGSPAYTTDRLGNSTGAINLANTAGGTATKYVRGTYSGSPIFSASFWMNPQTLSGVQQQVFVISGGYFVVYIDVNNKLGYYIPTGGGLNATTITTTSYTLTTSTWYHVCVIFQTNNTCSMYVNGSLVGSAINSGGFGSVTTSLFSFGCNDNSVVNAFNGYIDDFRLFNTALNATHVAALFANQTSLQCPSLSSSYLPSTSYAMPATLAPSAAINASTTSFNGQVMAVTTSGADTPLARLTLDNTNADAQGGVTPATGSGTVTYSTTIKKVGSHSAFFNNTSPGSIPTINLNYTVPTLLNMPDRITISCWIYPTSYAGSGNMTPLLLGGLSNVSNAFNITSSGAVSFFWSTTGTNTGTTLSSSAVAPLNTWSHLVLTYLSGTFTLYVNSVAVATSVSSGTLCVIGGGNITNLLLGSTGSTNAYTGYVDDVRLYTQALTATEIQSLYAFNNAANNVYYSVNGGSTWTPVTAPSTESLQGITVSADGSYLTAISNTSTYTLNTNSSGFALAVGNQAGQINQARNAIAIGNQAGVRNQTASSIVINATGSTVNAASQGFYVAPIATASSAAANTITVSGNTNMGALNLLAYGADRQVVQTDLTVMSNGSGFASTVNITSAVAMVCRGANAAVDCCYNNWYNFSGSGRLLVGVDGVGLANISPGAGFVGTLTATPLLFTTSFVERMRISADGNVGIGMTNPMYKTQILLSSNSDPGAQNCFALSTGSGGAESQRLYMGLVDNGGTGATSYSWISASRFGYAYNSLCFQPIQGNVGIGITNPSNTLHVNGICQANIFTSTYAVVGAFSSTNTFTVQLAYPASYLFTVNGNGGSINGGSGDGLTKAIMYITIGATGTLLTTVVQNVGIQINSYTTSTQLLSYNIGYAGQTVNGGSNCSVSFIRLA